MSLTLIGIDGTNEASAFHGIPTTEVGFNCESTKCEFTPAVRDKLNGITGEPRAFAVSTIPSAKLSLAGEVLKLTASGGALAATWIAAFVPANLYTNWNRSAGGFYLASASLEYARDAWFKMTAEFEADPLIA